MIRVLERARRAARLGAVYVATDEERVAAAVREAGGDVLMTEPDHPSGLDRVAEAAALLGLKGDAIVLNIQGDEPFASPEGLDHLVQLFERPEVRMATLAAPFAADDDPANPNRVKVVLDRMGRAIYFSRAPIPHADSAPGAPASPRLLHIGIYAYRFATLDELAALPPCPLERSERLEQLRALWNGIPIHVAVGDYHSVGIDTPEDLARARTRWEEGGARS